MIPNFRAENYFATVGRVGAQSEDYLLFSANLVRRVPDYKAREFRQVLPLYDSTR